jgi:hypothetical protein
MPLCYHSGDKAALPPTDLLWICEHCLRCPVCQDELPCTSCGMRMVDLPIITPKVAITDGLKAEIEEIIKDTLERNDGP